MASALKNITKKQWIATGIAIAVDILLILVGFHFSKIITEACAGNTVIPLIFNCGIILAMFIATTIIVRLVTK